MEILLAIVVASAVIFFGVLISMGNERQKKAIDGLREQVVLWAVQDLKLKREKLKYDVKVEDPLGWLNKNASRVTGYDLKLKIIDLDTDPISLICTSQSQGCSVIFSPLSPKDIRGINRSRKGRLSQLNNSKLLKSTFRNVVSYKLSLLNGNSLFDLELPLAWQGLTGIDTYPIDCLWMYIFN